MYNHQVSSEIEALKQEIQKATQECEKSRYQCDDIELRLGDAKTFKKQLESKKKELEQKSKDASEKVERLEKESKDLQKEKEETTKKRDDAQRTKDEKQRELEKQEHRLKEINDELKELESQRDEFKKIKDSKPPEPKYDIAWYCYESNTFNCPNCRAWRRKFYSTKKLTNQAEIDAHRNRVTQATLDDDKARKKIEALIREKLRLDLGNLRNWVRQEAQNMQEAEKKLVEQNKKMTENKEAYQKAQQEEQELKQKQSELEKELSKAEDKISGLERELNDAKTRCSYDREKLESLQNRLQELLRLQSNIEPDHLLDQQASQEVAQEPATQDDLFRMAFSEMWGTKKEPLEDGISSDLSSGFNDIRNKTWSEYGGPQNLYQ